MDTGAILAHLRDQASRIDRAIAALEQLDGKLGGNSSKPATAMGAGGAHRTMSAAARKRISARMKARWAERKGTALPVRHLSAAGRKRLSELAKARWAARKRQGKTSL